MINDTSDTYLSSYLKAVQDPIPEIRASFEAELKLLSSYVNENSLVLDVGCGIGRPTKELAPLIGKIEGIDHNPQMIELAQKRCAEIKNLKLSVQNGLKTNFKNNTFDLVYCTYNTIGSIQSKNTQSFINEMVRVTKFKGRVIVITWREGPDTTEILKRHYHPLISIKILDINDARTITDHGTFKRFTRAELEQYYQKAGLKEVVFQDVGPAWMAVIGVK